MLIDFFLKLKRAILPALLVCQVGIAGAGYEEDLEMFQARRGSEQQRAGILQAMRKKAEHGDLVSAKFLAEVLIHGHGVSRNLVEGRAWAKQVAAIGDADGQVLVYYAAFLDPEIALRSRAEEAFGYENLARAAAQGHVRALALLVTHYVEKIGPENHSRAEHLLALHPELPDPANHRRWLALVKHWGATRATPQLLHDSMGAAMAVAALKAGRRDCRQIAPQKLAIASDIRSPAYLALEHPALHESYLTGGNWTEHWTFSVCGAETTVQASFSADARSGADFGFEGR